MSDEETIAVPRKATFGMKTAATGFAMQSCITSSYSWHDYMADLWAVMVAHAPATPKPDPSPVCVESVKAEYLAELMAAACKAMDGARMVHASAHYSSLRSLTEGEG